MNNVKSILKTIDREIRIRQGSARWFRKHEPLNITVYKVSELHQHSVTVLKYLKQQIKELSE